VHEAWAKAKFDIDSRLGKLWPTSLFGLLLRLRIPVNKRQIVNVAKLRLRYLIVLNRDM
jgi:hypothetical protein